MMKRVALTYLSVLLVLSLLDGLWLGWLAKDNYQQQLSFLMRTDIPIWPWVTFYLLYPACIVYLAIVPSISLIQSGFRGVVLGLAAYGTYNLTNYSIVNNWPLMLTLQDWLWGCILTTVCALAGMQFWLRSRNVAK
jgi:uncharacterized membrane protein